MKILTISDIQAIITTLGFEDFLRRLVKTLETDFHRWPDFQKSARQATHSAHGVIELMPCSDQEYYTFKYVNGHPENTDHGKLNVVAIGQLSSVATGYPLMISDMTLLTALRTAATGGLAAKYLARDNSQSLAIIGNGAQSEFQTIVLAHLFPIREVRYYDTDYKAMEKFATNLADSAFALKPCLNVAEAIYGADMIVTATAAKKKQCLFTLDQLAPGTYIQGIGGDCPGKTELSRELMMNAKVVVEHTSQSIVEGDIQQCSAADIYAELWQLVCEIKAGRENNTEITVFDSVGFALEDFSILTMIYGLSNELQLGSDFELLPELDNPKDLYGLLRA
ncbi:MAG: ornithine cyclodeaminase [Methylococcales bacterium]|nr:ornithine cyclodeaminase [Methylococcales bacterium]